MRRTDNKRTVLQVGEYQRKDGSYYYRYKGADGKYKFIYAKTLRQLREKEKEAQELKARNVSLSTKRLNDIYEEWRRTHGQLVRTSTLANYTYLYDMYIRHSLGRKKLTDIKKADVLACYSKLRSNNGCSVNSVNNIHSVLHQLLGYAVEQNYIVHNPSDRCMVELRKVARTNTIHDIAEGDDEDGGVALTRDQQAVLLDFLKKSKTYNHWYPLIASMLLFGPRFGEISALQWSDVDFERNTIRINKTCVYLRHPETREMVYEMHPPKTEAGYRLVVMSKPLREILEAEKLIRDQRGRPYKANVDGYNDFVFVNRFGDPLNNINKTLKRIIRDCNVEQLQKKDPVLLPDFSSHAFRRTFATRMVEIGLNVKALQDILGHNDASTTLDIYAKVQRELKDRQTEKIDAEYGKMFATETV